VQNKVLVVSTIQLSIFSMSQFAFYLFVKDLNWGVLGVAMAINATSSATVLCMLTSLVSVTPCKQCQAVMARLFATSIQGTLCDTLLFMMHGELTMSAVMLALPSL
jgi:hypothetical protein